MYSSIQLCTEMPLIIQLHEMSTEFNEIPSRQSNVEVPYIMQLVLIHMVFIILQWISPC